MAVECRLDRFAAGWNNFAMKTPLSKTNVGMRFSRCYVVVAMAFAFINGPAFSADKTDSRPSEAEMARMMELAKPGEMHKVLAGFVGEWSYTVKMWMDPNPSAPPTESSGTAVIKAIMDGRFVTGEHSGKMQMPGPDGKTMDMDFKGMSIDGYDNVKKKFLSSWIDIMGTGIMNAEGDYDAAMKTLTYRAELEMMPGTKTNVREVIKVIDTDHHTFDWYEERAGKDVKAMEISYTRKS